MLHDIAILSSFLVMLIAPCLTTIGSTNHPKEHE